MVNLGYLGESRKIEFKEEDIKLFIVRRPVNGIPLGFIHIPDLSPSTDLFRDTKRWKNGEYTKSEEKYLHSLNVDISSSSWWYLYEPRFKEELMSDKVEAIFDRIKEVSRDKNIWIFCYCKDLERCHRFIVGKELSKRGINVNFREMLCEKEDFNQVTFFDDFQD